MGPAAAWWQQLQVDQQQAACSGSCAAGCATSCQAQSETGCMCGFLEQNCPKQCNSRGMQGNVQSPRTKSAAASLQCIHTARCCKSAWPWPKFWPKPRLVQARSSVPHSWLLVSRHSPLYDCVTAAMLLLAVQVCRCVLPYAHPCCPHHAAGSRCHQTRHSL